MAAKPKPKKGAARSKPKRGARSEPSRSRRTTARASSALPTSDPRKERESGEDRGGREDDDPARRREFRPTRGQAVPNERDPGLGEDLERPPGDFRTGRNTTFTEDVRRPGPGETRDRPASGGNGDPGESLGATGPRGH